MRCPNSATKASLQNMTCSNSHQRTHLRPSRPRPVPVRSKVCTSTSANRCIFPKNGLSPGGLPVGNFLVEGLAPLQRVLVQLPAQNQYEMEFEDILLERVSRQGNLPHKKTSIIINITRLCTNFFAINPFQRNLSIHPFQLSAFSFLLSIQKIIFEKVSRQGNLLRKYLTFINTKDCVANSCCALLLCGSTFNSNISGLADEIQAALMKGGMMKGPGFSDHCEKHLIHQRLLSSEYGTCKTVKARFWPYLSGESL